jgi:hypothetical protein
MPTREATVQALEAAVKAAREWFWNSTEKKTRNDFRTKKALGDDGSGAVYVFFDGNENALYVGQSGRHFKKRLYDPTSPHRKKPWWKKWRIVRFKQVHDQTDRLALELLVILALQPKFNSKPGGRVLAEMFGFSN